MIVRNLKDLGAIVREARVREGLNQTELAERIDTVQDWVSKLETGNLPNPGFARILKLCDLLKIDLRMGGTAPRPTTDPTDDSDLADDEPSFLGGPGR